MGETEDRDLARRIAARAQIRDIRLLESHILTEAIHSGGQLSFEFEVRDGEIDWTPGEDSFSVRCAYLVTLSESTFVEHDEDDAPSESMQALASIEFTLAALFQLELREEDDEPTTEELTAYGASTAAFAIYPFAREYVYSVTGRLRLPALTLPVKLIKVSKDEAVD